MVVARLPCGEILIEDLELDNDQRLYVVDSRLSVVRVFDTSQNFRYELGRPGIALQGLVEPMRAHALPSEGMAVVERTGYVKLFANRTMSAAAPTERWRLPVNPEDSCTLGDDLFVLGWQPAGRVHRFSWRGHRLDTFSPVYSAAEDFVSRRMSAGLLACVSDTLVVTMFGVLPDIYAYTAEGRVAWIARIGEFIPQTYTEHHEEGSVGLRETDGQVVDTPLTALTVAPGVLLIQLRREIRAEGRDTIRSYLIDVRTGQGGFVGEDIPLLHRILGRRGYTIEHSPIERVQIWRMPDQEPGIPR